MSTVPLSDGITPPRDIPGFRDYIPDSECPQCHKSEMRYGEFELGRYVGCDPRIYKGSVWACCGMPTMARCPPLSNSLIGIKIRG
jgi:hypothetical protein